MDAAQKSPGRGEKSDVLKLQTEIIGTFNTSGKNELIWLGHANYLFHLDGDLTILTDPVWLDGSESPIPTTDRSGAIAGCRLYFDFS